MIATNHKVFCSFAYTGEDKQIVRQRMELVTKAFQRLGMQAYCNLFDPRSEQLEGPRAFIDAALEEVKRCDIMFVVMASERRSEGMLLEIGAAYAMGKQLVLARHASAKDKTYLDQLVNKTIDWQTDDDLIHAIKTLIDV